MGSHAAVIPVNNSDTSPKSRTRGLPGGRRGSGSTAAVHRSRGPLPARFFQAPNSYGARFGLTVPFRVMVCGPFPDRKVQNLRLYLGERKT